MALPVAGGDEYPPFRPSGGPYYPAKRRTVDTVDDDHHLHYTRYKRPKYVPHAQFADPVAFRAVGEPPLSNYPPLHHPHPHPHPHLHHRYPSPLPHLPSPEPAGTGAPAMERTASGHSIRPDPTDRCASTELCAATELLDDHQAAQRVRDHLATFRRRNPDSKHERILRSIINPRPRRHPKNDRGGGEEEEEEYPLDNAALESIFSAANEIFFNGRLSQRVAWDWSHADSARYDSRVIGTTALRRAAASTRGYETLVVLSSTILRDAKYSRRLLISTFLHELIHCYLFICCGFRARWCGGHTDGFRDIAAVVDEWVGEGAGLFLKRIEADLELFRVGGCGGGQHEEEMGRGGVEERRGGGGGNHNVYPCSGMAAEQDEYAASASSPAVTSPAPQEAVYFGSGGGGAHGSGTGVWSQEVEGGYFGRGSAPNSGTGTPTQEGGYFGRGASPSPRASTPTQEGGHYYYHGRTASSGSNSSNSNSNSNSNNIWWRQRRAVRPLYVCAGHEPSASYVFPHTTGQRF
ncbi:hypothetical protein C8A00DRAFT_33977 [Chaetomidium leptoderma]|uniref:SprT-like domain-containing protein n=1 Tax=Chaetomidium leptoderma TaxID=669021 RepID=A0AAN6VKK1_9PEZI|nr:hypothetical protein C8A00DRAFT_33977 [Chaetomidium leptoderma]